MLCLVFLLAIAQVLAQAPCTENDYTAAYTQCSNNLRNLIYYWKDGVSCVGGVSLPQNVFNLPCNIACGEGYYLPLGARNCSMCQPGSFSIGGGKRVTDWDNWSQDFSYTTFCNDYTGKKMNTSVCAGWVAASSGVYISSGNITDNQQSVLQVPALLITDGHIHFEYRVDSEPNYDVLYFSINQQRIFTAKANADYVSFQKDLARGFYVFEWTYDKDPSVSEGEDAAFIKMLEIGGLDYAQSECTPCARGTYNPLSKQEDCQLCPADFYQNSTGATECIPCLDSEYSFVGSVACTQRPSCTTNDYSIVYSPCRAPGVRDKRYIWNSPIICDTASYNLPQDEIGISCGNCNPGEFRSLSTYQCLPCATGYASDGTQIACSQCSAGTIASRGYAFTHWDYLPDEMGTGCRGSCGTNGWRLLGDSIDSGYGHGDYVESFLEFNISLANVTGFVTFNFSLQCSQPCSLDFSDVGYRTDTYFFANKRVVSVKLIPDMDDPDEDGGLFHTLRWTFRKSDPREEGRSDRAIIHWVSVTNTIGGGASSCTSCTAGTFSPARSDRCQKCPIGQSSPQGSGTCSDCPANTFNDVEGGTCIACGHGTTSQPGATNCTFDCTYTVTTPDAVYEYDLSALKRTDEMYGPVYDNARMEYYINICSKEHHNHTCFTPSGLAIPSFACQITTQGWGVDIGKVIGFYELNGNPGDGIVINLSHGLKGCSNQVERGTNITFFCDPTAGVGQPVPGRGGLEKPACFYNFEWNSTYGCPLCTSKDYDFTFTECINGRQTKFFFWKENPKRCHDGVPLPASSEYSCQVSTLSCPPGQFALSGNNCTECAPGYYSIGSGVEYSDWTTLPAGFITQGNEGGLAPWQPLGRSIDSATFGDSILTVTKKFVTTGSITFWYKTVPYIESGTECYLSFSIDSTEVLRVVRLHLDYRNITLDGLAPGDHTFTWRFLQINRNSFTDNYHPYASISKIQFNGTASTFCSACPRGTAAPAFGSATCNTCAAGTYSNTASSTCLPCDPGYFSFEGSDQCRPIPACTADDYQQFFTNCTTGNTRSSYYVPLEPQICTGNQKPANETNLQCAPCPTGSIRNEEGVCTSCSQGWDILTT